MTNDRQRILWRNGILVVGFCIAAALVSVAFLFGRTIPFVQQWPLYEALRNTAAIIFAVVGAWLAIIYPERLKLSFGKATESKGSSANMGLLLTPAVSSTFILMMVLMVGVLAPILKQVPYLTENVDVVRGASFAFLMVLTIWQVVIVFIAIMPVEFLLNQVSKEIAQEEISKSYGSQHQKL